MNLKPQDVVVALKLFGYPNGRPAMSIVASDLALARRKFMEPFSG